MFYFLLVLEKAVAQELPLTHFTSDTEVHPLPTALVTQVYQDKLGFIWFANYSSGLVRHDGTGMDLYNQEDGLKDSHVWQLLEDGAGYLWVSSNSGLVVSEKPLQEYSSGERIHFTSVFKDVPLSNESFSHNEQLAKDADGRLWAATASKGILQYQIDRENGLRVDTLITNFGGEEILEIHSIAATPSGRMLAGVEGGKLASFKNGKSAVFFTPNKDSIQEDFTSILEDKSGRVWSYNQSGKLYVFVPEETEPLLVYSGPASNITSLSLVSSGEIFATNGESGINVFNTVSGKLQATYNRKNGLLSNNVYDLMEDREGNLWISQTGGVSKLKYNFRAFENYTSNSVLGEKPVLSSGAVNTIFLPETDSLPGRFWIGTEEGLTVVNDRGESQFLSQVHGLESDWVNGISSDQPDRVWIATTQGVSGLFFSDLPKAFSTPNAQDVEILGKQAKVVNLKNSPPSIAAESLKIYDEEKNVFITSSWFAGVKSVFGVIGEQTVNFIPQNGLPPSVYHAVAIDRHGKLWVGTRDKGLFRSTEKLTIQTLANQPEEEFRFEQVWSEDKGAPGNQIEKLLYHEGNMWVGTPQGLFALGVEDLQVRHQLTTAVGLPWNNAVSFAVSPTSGNLWVGTNGGLAEVDPVTGEVLHTVNRQDGLVANEVWLYGSVKINKAGEVFYGTSGGVSVYTPELNSPNKIPPVLQLKSADLSYKSGNRNEAAFEYVALSYSNVADVRYRTRLLGYENDFSPPTTETRLRYTNLPAYLWPKEYVLEVMAQNGSGVLSEEPLRYSFEVKPVWWLQWWAFLIYLLLIAVVIFAVDRIQRSRLIKKERDKSRLYEAQLKAETATARSNAAEAEAKALKAENEKKEVELEKANQLKRAYEELKAAQNQLIQAEKMASLGRLATGIAHEIKNPLNFINNFAELSSELVEELLETLNNGGEVDTASALKDIKMNAAKIEEHGKRADAIVRSMMRHARTGSSFYENLNLNEVVKKYVKLAWRGKLVEIPHFKARIIQDLQPEIDLVRGVETEIGQVLLNLIGNSLDAVWEKKMKNGKDYEPEVIISTVQKNGQVEVMISDNGPGVPKENKEKIFEPFFTTKPTGQGTGLGLSLSYTIITQGHNGSLQLEENRSTGAAFVVSLPVIAKESLAS